jgi:hypothetical protein
MDNYMRETGMCAKVTPAGAELFGVYLKQVTLAKVNPSALRRRVAAHLRPRIGVSDAHNEQSKPITTPMIMI